LRGVDFVPHYSFAEYDAAIGSDPDLIVIPYLPFRNAPEYQTIMAWVRAHAGPRTILLPVCAGALNLADTGLLAKGNNKLLTVDYHYGALAHNLLALVNAQTYGMKRLRFFTLI
jgi:hypothetical protein